jgi:hypothetical protein
VSSRLVFAGSKRAARETAAEQRELRRVKAELQEIAALAPLIRDDAHFQQILADVPDDGQRAAVETLLTPFLRYRIERVDPC